MLLSTLLSDESFDLTALYVLDWSKEDAESSAETISLTFGFGIGMLVAGVVLFFPGVLMMCGCVDDDCECDSDSFCCGDCFEDCCDDCCCDDCSCSCEGSSGSRYRSPYARPAVKPDKLDHYT